MIKVGQTMTLTSLRFCLEGNNAHHKEQWSKSRLYHNMLHSWQKSGRGCEVSSTERVRERLMFKVSPG